MYGKNPAVPFSEDMDSVIGNPDVKRWAYAISKMFEEQLFFAYHERFGIDVVLLRFFGGYGPNQNLTWWGGPQSVFIDKALDDEALRSMATAARRAPSPTSQTTWLASSLQSRATRRQSGGQSRPNRRSASARLAGAHLAPHPREDTPADQAGSVRVLREVRGRRAPRARHHPGARRFSASSRRSISRLACAETIRWQTERRRSSSPSPQ